MRLDRVGFRYGRGRPWVLNDVTIDIPTDRVVEVTGRNGAGKSTLLRLLAGVHRPQRGRVLDRPTVVGYAPERFPVQPFSAMDYLGAMADVRGVPRSVIGEWAERLFFSDLLAVRLGELSKGSLHKVGLIQALLATAATPACLLLFDEPFAGLDTATRGALPGLLRRLAADGATVIVTDHQGDLRKLDGIAHWNVHDHHVTLGETAPAVSVLRVVVPVEDADSVTAKLQAEGYQVEDER